MGKRTAPMAAFLQTIRCCVFALLSMSLTSTFGATHEHLKLLSACQAGVQRRSHGASVIQCCRG